MAKIAERLIFKLALRGFERGYKPLWFWEAIYWPMWSRQLKIARGEQP